jgi:N utilization substance protein A
MKVCLDTETIRIISLFQQITGSHVIDGYENDEIYFIVAENHYGLAVGKGGIKIKKAESVFKKPIKVYEYSPDIHKFIMHLIPEAKEILIDGKSVEVRVSPQDRPKVIGPRGKKIQILERFLSRLHDVESFKVK